MTAELLPPAQRQTAASLQLTKWCSLSERGECLHPLPQLRSPLPPPHASLSQESFPTLLSMSLFISLHFCSFQAWCKSTLLASVYFCLCFFYALNAVPSLSFCFLYWLRREEIRAKQGTLGEPISFWNISVSRRQWETRGNGERMEQESDDKKTSVTDRKGSAVQTDKEEWGAPSDPFWFKQAASAAHSLCRGLISI